MFDINKLTEAQQVALYSFLWARRHCLRAKSSVALMSAIIGASYWLAADIFRATGQGTSWMATLAEWMLVIGAVVAVLSFGLVVWIERKAKDEMRQAGFPERLIGEFWQSRPHVRPSLPGQRSDFRER